MRKLFLTSLLIVAAFALGYVTATAQNQEITWDYHGDFLTLTNHTVDQGFFVEGGYQAGSTEPVPDARVKGEIVLSATEIKGVLVSKKVPLFHCDGIECRSCDDAPTLCVYPPRPLPEPPIGSSLDPY